jgi:hypothetical protein
MGIRVRRSKSNFCTASKIARASSADLDNSTMNRIYQGRVTQEPCCSWLRVWIAASYGVWLRIMAAMILSQRIPRQRNAQA